MRNNNELRVRILNEIRRLAAENGNAAPGVGKFEKETGIRESAWSGKIWARWSDALSEAGFTANQFQGALPLDFLFQKLRDCCRHYGRFPTKPEMKLFRQIDNEMPSANVYQNRFDAQTMRQEFRRWMFDQADLTDTEIDMLGSIKIQTASDGPALNGRTNGFVYAIKFGQFYKIGRSDDIERRVKQISIALPEKGEIVHFIETDDPVGIEEYWHKRFVSYRENGEWFRLPDSELAAFKKRKFQ